MFERLAPQLSVELGSGSGASLRPLCQVAGRFGRGGKIIGIDSWRSDPSAPWDGESLYTELLDYCATRHADVASLLRTDPTDAVHEFDDGTIDFLHIAPPPRAAGYSFDASAWMPKLRPGGVAVVTCADDRGPGEHTTKIWQQISESHPSAVLDLHTFVGVAEHPRDGATSLVEHLLTQSRAASALFRSLGERVDLRHVLTSEPISAGGIQRYVAELIDAHAAQSRAAKAQHDLSVQALEERLSSASERLLAKSSELGQLQNETDYLMAKLADQSAKYERRLSDQSSEYEQKIADQSAQHDRYVSDLRGQLEAAGRRCDDLQRSVATREMEIEAIKNTVSWRLTRPLRGVQSLRLKHRRPAG